MSLIFDAVDFSYPGGAAPVLAGLSLTVPPTGVTAILGPSGGGKTTLLHLAAGVRRPTNGVIVNTFTRAAMVFQEPRLLPWRTAIDNVAFGLRALGVGKRERRQTAATLIERLGLPADAGGRYPAAFSGGMGQRLGLARALAVDPDLLLLDEPFNAADPGLRRDLQDLVRALIDERQIAALLVTHDVTEAIRLADRLVVLSGDPGRIVHQEAASRPFAARDDAYVVAAARAFMAKPAVAAALTPERPAHRGA